MLEISLPALVLLFSVISAIQILNNFIPGFQTIAGDHDERFLSDADLTGGDAL